MAIAIETFEMIETEHETGKPECDAEAVALIESLGLEGQQKFIRRAEGETGTTITRCPYRKMTADEFFTYSHLCPKITELHRYDDGPIPVRVLQVAAHAKGLFDKIEVWSAESADVKDPVLVGIKGRNSWDSNYERFILARWADMLDPYQVCFAKAAGIFRDKYKAVIAKGIAELKGAADAIADIPDSQLVGKAMPYVGGVS